MAQTHIQQYQISGSLSGDISDSVQRGDLVKAGRSLADDLNSLRTQVKGILGAETWTSEQAITLQNLKAQLTGSLIANSGSFAGDLSVAGEATLASAVISDLTQSRVVFAGADGALVDDDSFTFTTDGTAQVKLGKSGLGGEIAVNNSSNNRTVYVDGDGAGLYVGGPVDGTLSVKDSANQLRAIIDPSGLTLRDSSQVNRMILDASGGLYAYDSSGSQSILLDGSTGNADINGTLDVAGQVDLAASGVATSVRGTLSVAEETTLASAIVSDLTDTRVVFAGASGALVDDAAMTFNSATSELAVMNGAFVKLDGFNGLVKAKQGLEAGGSGWVGMAGFKDDSGNERVSIWADQPEMRTKDASGNELSSFNNDEVRFYDSTAGKYVSKLSRTEFKLEASDSPSRFSAGTMSFGLHDGNDVLRMASQNNGSLRLRTAADADSIALYGENGCIQMGGTVNSKILLSNSSNYENIALESEDSTITVRDAVGIDTVVIDGVAGSVSGSGNFQAGGTLTVAGNSDLNGTLDVAGQVDLAASGVATSVRGTLSVAELADFNGDVTANKISIDSDVAQRLYIVDADGSMKDEANMTFDGSTLAVTGAISGSGNFQVGGTLEIAGSADFNGGITANELKIDGDVAQRLYIVDADGSIKDESKLTFDGSEMAVDGDLAITGNAAFAGNVQVDGDLRVKGSMTYIDTTNMRVQDAFIYLATGSLGTTDSGIVLHGGAGASMDLVLGQDGGAGEFILGKADRSPDGDGEMDGISLVPAWLSEVKVGSAEGALSGSMSIAGNDIKLAAAAAAIVFDDAYRASSTYSAPIKLAASAAEWTAFQTQYPGKSLLGALGAGGGVGVNFRKKVIMGSNANFSGNTLDIAAAGIGTLRSTAQVDSDYGLDVYLNGVLLALGASADYTVPSTTQISFNYALNNDDVLTIVAKNVA